MGTVSEPAHSVHPAGGRRGGGKRRRPSGEPPALPRSIGWSGRFWIGMVVYIVGVFLFIAFFHPAGAVIERFDVKRLVWISELRTHWLTRVMLVLNGLGSSYTVRGLRWVA